MTEMISERLILIGASGHGKVVADIARLIGYSDIVFLDDREDVTKCGQYPVLGKPAELERIPGDVFVSIGRADIRSKFMERYRDRHFPILVHPDAVIAGNAELGIGTVVMAGCVINTEVQIGRGCIINTCSSVDHECVLGDFVHIAVGAHLCGSVKVGNFTWVGAGATVINNVEISDNALVGAGGVVIKDINIPGTYVGVPAKMLKKIFY